MKKRFRNILFMLAGFLLFGSGLASFKTNHINSAKADASVATFLNVNTNHHHEALTVNGVAAHGFMLHYDIPFSSFDRRNENLLDTKGTDAGTKITFNGTILDDIPNFCCTYFKGSTGEMLWLKIPDTMLNNKNLNGYDYPTVFIPAGTLIYEAYTKEDVIVYFVDNSWSTTFGSDVIFLTNKHPSYTVYDMKGGHTVMDASIAGYTGSTSRVLKLNESNYAIGATFDFSTKNYDVSTVNSITFKMKFEFSGSITGSEFRLSNDSTGQKWILRYSIDHAINNTWYTLTFYSNKTVVSDIPSGAITDCSGLSLLGDTFGVINASIRIKPDTAKMSISFGDITIDGTKSQYANFLGVNQYNNNVYVKEASLYQTMLEFDRKFSEQSTPDTNIATANNDIANKMTLNGVLVKNIPNFFASYYFATDVNTPMLLLKIPETAMVTTEEYSEITLNIPAGTQIYDLKVKQTIELAIRNNKWTEPLRQCSFVAVNSSNNNRYDASGDLYHTMLEFDREFCNENRASINIAIASEDLGNKMTLNGVPVKDISGFYAAYYFAVDVNTPMLWMKIPASAFTTTEDYPRTTLEIPKGTIIYDGTVKNNVKIVLNNNKWLATGKWNPDPEPIDDYDYSFAIVGDTQDVNISEPQNYHKIYDWIVDNKEEKKIAHTIGLGDITNNDTDAEWARARDSFDKLEEAEMTHTQVRGNHDSQTKFNNFFMSDDYYKQGVTRYDNTILNHYREITIGKVDYLILALDYGPTNGALEWANKVVEDHPYHNVIVVTHGYLFRDGTTLGYTDELTPSTNDKDDINNGEEIWNNFVKKHENISMVISGHIYCENVLITEATGDNGNKVTQVLIDPQQMDRSGTRTGLVAMFYFSNDGKNVQVEYYATILELYETTSPVKKTTLNVQSREDFAPEQAEIVDDLIDEIGTVTLNSKGAIDAARGAYDDLTAEAKAVVTKLSVLEAAETTYANLKAADEQATSDAAEVDELIKAIGTVSLDSKTAIETAREAYDDLSAEAKARVTLLDTLEAAETTYAALKAADDQAASDAAAVDVLINNIGTVTLNSKTAIDAARAGYNALSAAAKAKVTCLATLEAAETTYASLKAADDKATNDAALVDALINNIGEVTLYSKTSIEQARTAYNALSDAAKAKVKKLSVLEAAETTYANLKAADDQATSDAAAVDELINSIGEVTLKSKDTIEAAREAYDALSDAAKAKVTGLSTLEAAEARLLELQNSKKNGCSGSFLASSSMISIIAIAGIVILLKKRKFTNI